MRRLAVLLLLVGLIGCGSTPQWASEREEFDYLTSLSNPTPEQWKRREEIGKRYAAEAAAKLAAQAKADRAREAAERAEYLQSEVRRKTKEDREKVDSLLSRADKYEAEKEYGLAYKCLKEAADDFPHIPETQQHEARMKELYDQAYGEKARARRAAANP